MRDMNREFWGPGRIFWGVILVFVGLLLLLGTFNVLTVNIGAVWRLWPLVLIAVGISIFAPKGRIAQIGSIILTIITAALIFLVTTGHFNSTNLWSPDTQEQVSNPQRETISRNATASSAHVTIDTGAASLNITADAGTNLAEATLYSEQRKLEVSNEEKDGVQTAIIKTSNRGFFWGALDSTKLDVALSRELPLDLVVDSGASNIKGDLSQVSLKSLTIDSGASNLEFTLGDKQANQSVTIDGGASNMNFRVPNGVGVQVKMDAGLVSKDFEGLREVTKDTYESDGFSTAPKKITITIDAGASRITLERY